MITATSRTTGVDRIVVERLVAGHRVGSANRWEIAAVVRVLDGMGWTAAAISAHLGRHRRTVVRYRRLNRTGRRPWGRGDA